MSTENGQPPAPNSFSFPWQASFIRTVGAVLVTFVTLTGLGIASAVVQHVIGKLPVVQHIDAKVFAAAFELGAYVVMFGGCILLLRAFVRSGRSLAELTSSTCSLLRNNIIKVAGIGVIGYVAAMIITTLVYQFIPLPEPASPAGDFAKTLPDTAFIFFAISACIAAPLMEEMLFRGLLQNMFRGSLRASALGRFSTRAADAVAIVLIAALFAIAHGTLSGFPPLFVTGLVLGIVYARTNNLWASIAIHAVNNIIATIALWSMLH